MPYKLRKVPKKDLYWVIGEDGKHHSKEGLPKDKAQAQMRALYASMDKEGKGPCASKPVKVAPAPPPPVPRPRSRNNGPKMGLGRRGGEYKGPYKAPPVEDEGVITAQETERTNKEIAKLEKQLQSGELERKGTPMTEAQWQKREPKREALRTRMRNSKMDIPDYLNETYPQYLARFESADTGRLQQNVDTTKKAMDWWKSGLDERVKALIAQSKDPMVASRFNRDGTIQRYKPFTQMPLSEMISLGNAYAIKNRPFLEKLADGAVTLGDMIVDKADMLASKLGPEAEAMAKLFTTAYKEFGAKNIPDSKFSDPNANLVDSAKTTFNAFKDVNEKYNKAEEERKAKEPAPAETGKGRRRKMKGSGGTGWGFDAIAQILKMWMDSNWKDVKLTKKELDTLTATISSMFMGWDTDTKYDELFDAEDQPGYMDKFMDFYKKTTGTPWLENDVVKGVLEGKGGRRGCGRGYLIMDTAETNRILRLANSASDEESREILIRELGAIPKSVIVGCISADDRKVSFKTWLGDAIKNRILCFKKVRVDFTDDNKECNITWYDNMGGDSTTSDVSPPPRVSDAEVRGFDSYLRRVETSGTPSSMYGSSKNGGRRGGLEIRKGNSPALQKALNDIGTLPVVDIKLRRDPIGSAINTALNAISFGKWEEAKKKYGYDKLFHTSLEFTVQKGNSTELWLIEKNAVVELHRAKPRTKDTELMDVGPMGLSIASIINTARAKMGDNFYLYDAFNNNCQDFVAGLLRASGLATKERLDWIKQPIDKVLAEMPSYTQRLARAVTDTGAMVDVVRQGGFHPAQLNAFAAAFARAVPQLGNLYLDNDMNRRNVGALLRAYKLTNRAGWELLVPDGSKPPSIELIIHEVKKIFSSALPTIGEGRMRGSGFLGSLYKWFMDPHHHLRRTILMSILSSIGLSVGAVMLTDKMPGNNMSDKSLNGLGIALATWIASVGVHSVAENLIHHKICKPKDKAQLEAELRRVAEEFTPEDGVEMKTVENPLHSVSVDTGEPKESTEEERGYEDELEGITMEGARHILKADYEITTNAEARAWLKKHHSDKGGKSKDIGLVRRLRQIAFLHGGKKKKTLRPSLRILELVRASI